MKKSAYCNDGINKTYLYFDGTIIQTIHIIYNSIIKHDLRRATKPC